MKIKHETWPSTPEGRARDRSFLILFGAFLAFWALFGDAAIGVRLMTAGLWLGWWITELQLEGMARRR